MLNGGIPLRGEVSISGAKNAVVAILPATILAQDVCVIENIPNISDVYYMTKILEQLGARRSCSRRAWRLSRGGIYRAARR